MLEYSGRGKSIHDVGLAQARFPLDTANHYFEIEIVDPGENCYIAIGIARRVGGYICQSVSLILFYILCPFIFRSPE